MLRCETIQRQPLLKLQFVLWVVLALLFGMGSSSTLFAEESRGTLRGRFVYDGEAPERKKVLVTKDKEICGALGLQTEQLVVSEDGGIADVILWARTKNLPEPEGLTKGVTVELDNKGCRFEPHVATMRPGDTLKVKNSDPTAHNTQISFTANSPFNEGIAVGGVKELKPRKAERYPVDVSCSIHPWMRSYLLVQDTPYVAVTDANGNFEIKDLPAGVELEFQVYHPKSKQIKKVTQDGKAVKWKRGRFKTKVSEGGSDMGELRLSPEVFN